MGFYDWLISRRITDTPRGDFIQDAKESSDFPRTDDRRCVEGYLKKKHACKEAIQIFGRLWNQYEKERNVRK